jgi:hypothetical protein
VQRARERCGILPDGSDSTGELCAAEGGGLYWPCQLDKGELSLPCRQSYSDGARVVYLVVGKEETRALRRYAVLGMQHIDTGVFG